MSRRRKTAQAVLAWAVVMVVFGCGAGAAPTSVGLSPRPTVEVVTDWYSGSDWKRYQADRTIAWKWDTNPSESWGVMVTTRDGCPNSLYVELSVITDSGTVVGYTNDSVGAVPAGGEARLSFSNFSDGGTKARLTEISCY